MGTFLKTCSFWGSVFTTIFFWCNRSHKVVQLGIFSTYHNWEYFLHINEKNKEEETIMMPQKDHYSQKHLTTRERARERNCSNMTESLERKLISTIFILFPFLSSPTKSTFNFLSIPKEVAKVTAILSHFLLKKKPKYWRGTICLHRSSSLFSTGDAVFQILPPSQLTPLQPTRSTIHF